MFTRTYRIKQVGDGAVDRDVLSRLRDTLLSAGARSATLDGDTVTFEGSTFPFGPNLAIMMPISRGKVSFSSKASRTTIELTFNRLFVTGGAMAIAAAIWWKLEGAPLVHAVAGGAFFVFWLVGMNVLIAVFRFVRLVRGVLSGVGYDLV